MLNPLWIALRFLTRLPAPEPRHATPEDLGRSVLAYPLVGLLIGVALAVLASALAGSAGLLGPALVLALWAGLTGGLHLDGLADTADGWIGGIGDRERTLEIMRDSCSGAAGVTAIALVLIVKLGALSALVAWPVLLVVPVLGRTAAMALLISTPYLRPGGIAAPMIPHLSGATATMVAGGAAILSLLLLGWAGVAVLAAAALAAALMRGALMARLGGITGDTLGATIELVEVAALVVAVGVMT